MREGFASLDSKTTDQLKWERSIDRIIVKIFNGVIRTILLINKGYNCWVNLSQQVKKCYYLGEKKK